MYSYKVSLVHWILFCVMFCFMIIPKGIYTGTHLFIVITLPLLVYYKKVKVSVSSLFQYLFFFCLGCIYLNLAIILLSLFMFVLECSLSKFEKFIINRKSYIFNILFFLIILSIVSQIRLMTEYETRLISFFPHRLNLFNWDPNFSGLLVFIIYLLNDRVKPIGYWCYRILLLFLILGFESRMVFLGIIFYLFIKITRYKFKKLYEFINLKLFYVLIISTYMGVVYYFNSKYNLISIITVGTESVDSSTIGRFVGVSRSFQYIQNHLASFFLNGDIRSYISMPYNLLPHNTFVELVLEVGFVFTIWYIWKVLCLLSKYYSVKNFEIVIPYLFMTIPLHSIFLPIFLLPIFIVLLTEPNRYKLSIRNLFYIKI